MLARTITLAIAGAALVSACSKSDPPLTSKVPERPAAVKAATPAPAAVPTPAPAAATRSEPPKPAAPRARSATPATAPAQSAPPPRTDLAAAAPSSAVPAASESPRLVSRVDPDFPREAVQAGADAGSVKARMTLDAGGNVTRVEIVEANPRRVFDRAVVRALSQWRYNDGAAGRTVDMEVAFKR